MDIHQLRIFTSVYRNKSFTRASEQLYISQPTISEHIKNLEKDLGCTLFDRLGRKIVPTGEADLIFPQVLQLIEDLERIKDMVKESGHEIKGNLLIGASTIPGNYMLPSLAAAFRRLYPKVSFEIVIADTRKITDMIMNHDLLMGIVGASMEPRILKYDSFQDDELVFAGAPVHTAGCIGDLAGIYDIPFLLREEGSGTRKTMEQYLRRMNIDLKKMNVVAVLGSTDAIKQAMKASLGTSILSRRAIVEELDNGTLEQVELKVPMHRPFYIATHKKRTLPSQYKVFQEFLRS